MGIITNIRTKAGQYFLKKSHSGHQRQRQAFNLNQAQTFGIIYEAIDKESFDIIQNFHEVLKYNKKTVKVLGYVPAKRYDMGLMLNLETHLYKWSDVNWYYKPTLPAVNEFIENEFDMLLDFSLNPQMPIVNVVAASKAKFKVGRYTDSYQNYYDMMLDAPKDISLKEYMRIVRKYLAMINNTEFVEE